MALFKNNVMPIINIFKINKMSDYVHNKVVRFPFPKEVLKKCNTEDAYDCEHYLSDLLGELWGNNKKNSFKLVETDEAYYIDWVYYSTYGENSGNFGNVRMLSANELKAIKPYFDKLQVKYNDSDLRAVEYCYYNCSEAPDFYEIESKDDSWLFFN